MTIPQTLRRWADKIQEVEDDRANDNGWWVHLKDGWKNGEDPLGVNHTIHETTLKECADIMRNVIPCDCEDCLVSD